MLKQTEKVQLYNHLVNFGWNSKPIRLPNFLKQTDLLLVRPVFARVMVQKLNEMKRALFMEFSFVKRET